MKYQVSFGAKTWYLHMKNITWPLGDTKFLFSCWKNISLVRCAHSWNIFQLSKRNFVSPRGHVISSISPATMRYPQYKPRKSKLYYSRKVNWGKIIILLTIQFLCWNAIYLLALPVLYSSWDADHNPDRKKCHKRDGYLCAIDSLGFNRCICS